MQCGVCVRTKQQLSCAECARSGLWPLRTEYLFKTAERDGASEKVEEYLEGPSRLRQTERQEAVKARVRGIRKEAARLRESLLVDNERRESLLSEVLAKKKRLEDANAAARKQDQALGQTQADINRVNSERKALHFQTMKARSFLCREAASLYGLRMKRRKSGRVEYIIGGHLLPNLLQDLNSSPPSTITTSLSHLAHLIVLISHYTGLKLPHEIILPLRDTPTTSIRGVLHNRHFATRPLYLEHPLSTLSRETPMQHTKFIEAVTMLAFNLSFLCFSQGLEINNVEDACNLGHNIWKLLVAKDSTAAVSQSFGRMSHATTIGNLAVAEGLQMMTGWTLGYKSLVEKVRYTLQGDTIVADWDLIPEAEKEAAEADAVSDGLNRWTRVKSPGEGK